MESSGSDEEYVPGKRKARTGPSGKRPAKKKTKPTAVDPLLQRASETTAVYQARMQQPENLLAVKERDKAAEAALYQRQRYGLLPVTREDRDASLPDAVAGLFAKDMKGYEAQALFLAVFPPAGVENLLRLVEDVGPFQEAARHFLVDRPEWLSSGCLQRENKEAASVFASKTMAPFVAKKLCSLCAHSAVDARLWGPRLVRALRFLDPAGLAAIGDHLTLTAKHEHPAVVAAAARVLLLADDRAYMRKNGSSLSMNVAVLNEGFHAGRFERPDRAFDNLQRVRQTKRQRARPACFLPLRRGKVGLVDAGKSKLTDKPFFTVTTVPKGFLPAKSPRTLRLYDTRAFSFDMGGKPRLLLSGALFNDVDAVRYATTKYRVNEPDSKGVLPYPEAPGGTVVFPTAPVNVQPDGVNLSRVKNLFAFIHPTQSFFMRELMQRADQGEHSIAPILSIIDGFLG